MWLTWIEPGEELRHKKVPLAFVSSQEKIRFTFKHYAPRMKTIGMVFLKDESLAEDAVQDAFLDIMKKIDDIVIESCHKMPPLIGYIVKYKAIDIMKKRKKVVYVDFQEEMVIPIQLTTYDGVEYQMITDVALERLSEEDRWIILHKLFLGDDYGTLANALGITQGAVRKRYERARKRMVEILKKLGVNL